MKVLHLSSANKNTGAGIACYNLHINLVELGVDSKILFLAKDSFKDRNIYYFETNLFNKTKRLLITFLDRIITFRISRNNNRNIFSPGLFGQNIEKHALVKSADIIHLHWINHGFVNVGKLSLLKKPIIITMHDCWLFTGGCHHFLQCRKFETNCTPCPELNSINKYFLSEISLKTKKKTFEKIHLKIVAISRWMKKNAEKSSILHGKEINVIPSGIDTNIFNYRIDDTIREKHKIQNSDKVILIGAQDLSSKFKGLNITKNILEQYENTKLTIITFGKGLLELVNKNHRVINLGFLNNQNDIAYLFAIADVFLSTSVAEGFGMTIAEAQCCGTPTIAFDNTGPADIINHKKSGYLANYLDVNDIINGIDFCLNFHFNRKQISEEAINKFSLHSCAKEYKTLYINSINE